MNAVRSEIAVVLFAALTLLVVLCARLRTGKFRSARSETHKRGVLLADGAPMQRRGARRKRLATELVTLAGVDIPPIDETKHFKLIGTTGTGKSTAIRELLGCAIARRP
jgi:hypothetical protein